MSTGDRSEGRSQLVLASHVEAEENHVAIAHDVIFSFHPKLARFASFREGTERDEIVVVNCFRAR